MKITTYKNVTIGKKNSIGEHCIIGMPPRGKKDGELLLKIGDNSCVRAFSVIYSGSVIGNHFETGTRVSIREDNFIGDNVIIGTGSVLEYGNRIGNNVRIHSNCFLELAVIENNVFIGPGVIMTDDPHPPCPEYKKCKGGVTIGNNSSVGAGAILLPGVRIGKNVLIGAGSVIVENVPDNVVVAGNPGKIIKKRSELKCWKKIYNKPYDWQK